MKSTSRYLFLLIFTLQLAGCSSRALNWSNGYHTVRAGETLYSVAVRYNLDYQDLARWNRLGDGSLIREGQQLRLTPPADGGSVAASGPAKEVPVTAAAPRWYWPTDGTVYLRFRESTKTSSGIRVEGASGQPIRAVAAGQVVYAGSGLASYGQLLIIKHNDSWLSAYGFNRSLLVAEGQTVAAGQPVAEMGKDPAGRPVLHFEIRKNGQPVDPLRYLPAR